MKYFLALITFSFFSPCFYGQSINDSTGNSSDSIYTNVDAESFYKGGEKAWRTFLENNLNPMILVDNNAPLGVYRVVINFVIKSDGSIQNIQCEDSPQYGMCEEGIRIIKKSKKWIPAKVNGKNVNSFKKQPITFARIGGL